MYSVSATSNGMSDWTIQGVHQKGPIGPANDPTLELNVEDILEIQNNASGSHPLYIKTIAGIGTGNQVSGVTNQGGYGGQKITWSPTTPGTFYYQCSNHSGMVGQIIVHALPVVTPTPITALSTPEPYYIYPTPTIISY